MWRVTWWRALLVLASALWGGCSASQPAAFHQRSDMTGIDGQVHASAEQDVKRTVVYAYRNARGNLRGPADFSAVVDAEGRYFLDLVEGRYYLVARRRAEPDRDEGPPRPGDVWAVHPDNPVEVRPGYMTRVDFYLPRTAQMQPTAVLSAGDTGLRGRLVDSSGQPLAALVVLAYPSESERGRGKPEHLSRATDADGRFVLYLPQGGRYCLMARDQGRGRPGASDLYEIAGSDDAFCPSLSKGQIKDLGILTLQPRR